jgi:hypothetical protein
MSKARKRKRDQRRAGHGAGASAAEEFEDALRRVLDPVADLTRLIAQAGLKVQAAPRDDPRAAESVARQLAGWHEQLEAAMNSSHPPGACCDEYRCHVSLIAATLGVAGGWATIGRHDLAMILIAALDMGHPDHAWRLATMAGAMARLVPAAQRKGA